MPQAEEQRAGSAMVATLSTPGQARVQRASTSRAEVEALVEQRSVESAVTRMARQEADASL
eukprot:3584600-Alexandrium_andersonii.AAC.1